MRALSVAGVCFPLGAWALISAVPVSGQVSASGVPPMEITSDTPEYCQKLLRRIGEIVRLAAEPVPHEATDLTSEGQKMCDHGQTRMGIMRLRSALMIMQKYDEPAYR